MALHHALKFTRQTAIPGRSDPEIGAAFGNGTPPALPCAVTLKYRLLRRIVGMYENEIGAIMIPAGSIVEIAPTRSTVGVVTASHEGRMIWVFPHDLLDAGRIEPTGDVG